LIFNIFTRPTNRVFNFSSSKEILILWEDIIKVAYDLINDYALSYMLWYPGKYTTRHYWLYKIQSVFYHWIPAYILDALVALTGREKL
jgi:alcohol-forming fatty acyl-CoA reductase